MLSIGAVVFTDSGEEIGSILINLKRIPDSIQDPDTMKWWSKFPEAWAAIRKDPQDIVDGMERFASWLRTLQKTYRLNAVCYPAGFDWLWVYWYMRVFLGKDSPFNFAQVIDVKTLAWSVMGGRYGDVTKRTMPERWKNAEYSHPHVPDEDAREQGHMFFAILADVELDGRR